MTDDTAVEVIESKPSPKPRVREESERAEAGTAAESLDDKAERRRGWQLPRGRGLVVTVLVLLIVAFGATSGVFFFQYRSGVADQSSRDDALAAAKAYGAQLLSYDYRMFDAQLATSLAGTTGGFHDEFSQLMTQVVAPTAKQQQVVTTSTVAAASVVDGGGDKVTVLLFVNQSTTAKDQQGVKIGLSNVRMELQRSGDQWLVSNVQPV